MRWRRLVVLVAIAPIVIGCGVPPGAPGTTVAAVGSSEAVAVGIPDGSARLVTLTAAEHARAAEVIAELSVRGRGPKTGYQRVLFGPAWADDAVGVLWSGNGCRTRDDILARDLDGPVKRDACVVVSGAYLDPYTTEPVHFGKADAVLTTRPVNQAKGDSDPASWLPPNKAIRCSYAERFAMVSLKYGLPVTPADKPIMLPQCAGG